ncbi:MAG: UDP-2,3-diacylglucosamine diphosphatase [Bacteroidota bacterium]
METRKFIYFASDFHLGAGTIAESLLREKKILRWLDQEVKPNASELYLLGDIFECWFEYKKVVPRGFTRLLGKLAELGDLGIQVTIFTGTHDVWMFGYLEEELGVTLNKSEIIKEWGGKKFLLGHGDGLGPGDYGYKRMKKVFTHPLAQWAYSQLHPNLGLSLAQYFSSLSRKHNTEPQHFMGVKKEWLVQYCEKKITEENIDYFIFGHRHLPINLTLSNKKSRYINLGDWMTYFSYARWDGTEMYYHFFENNQGEVYENI